jgi:hypothetical protein
MALLEHCEPPTIHAAALLVTRYGAMTSGAFDLIADAWETYRHLSPELGLI